MVQKRKSLMRQMTGKPMVARKAASQAEKAYVPEDSRFEDGHLFGDRQAHCREIS
jgi:hypothetical protein